jgi:hypothetical protein
MLFDVLLITVTCQCLFYNMGSVLEERDPDKQLSSPLFRTRDILRRILIFGSVHWITPDPDPALFWFSRKQPKISFFCLLLTVASHENVQTNQGFSFT